MPSDFLDRAKKHVDPISPAERLTYDRKIRTLEDKLRNSQASYKHAIARLEEAERVADFLDAFDDPRPAQPFTAKKSKGSPYCAIACASDWHLGEVIEKGQVNGLNEFNQEVAERRVKKFFTKIPEYVDRYAPGIGMLAVWAGGDFISGHIHPDLSESNSISPTEECLWFRDLWSDGLATLLRRMPKTSIIIPTSIGNHGRTTPKMRVTTAAQTSFEQMTYKMLARDWVKEKRVEWRISPGYHNIVPLLGRRVRFHHGDAIQYQGGIGGITIPVKKAIAQWNKGDRCDLDIFGHFHEHISGNGFVGNGCLVGYSPFSLKIKAEYQPPTQSFIVFDAKHGLRYPIPIFVDD